MIKLRLFKFKSNVERSRDRLTQPKKQLILKQYLGSRKYITKN